MSQQKIVTFVSHLMFTHPFVDYRVYYLHTLNVFGFLPLSYEAGIATVIYKRGNRLREKTRSLPGPAVRNWES